MIDLRLGDCRALLKTVPDDSVNAVVCDPAYPCIDRKYGRLTESQWHTLMDVVVPECRRILKPTGSAVFILQPNSERVGRMRPWLWEFMAKWSREWNQIQDAWWWNFVQSPTVHCHHERGLMRPSLKAVVWLGDPDCFRSQESVLWEPSLRAKAWDLGDRAMRINPSGTHNRSGRACSTAVEHGGATPFNVLPIANANSASSAGAHGHGAGTPEPLMDWWTRYICPPDGTLCDPFMGSGTAGIVAVKRGLDFIGFEQMPEYFETAQRRIAAELSRTALLPA